MSYLWNFSNWKFGCTFCEGSKDYSTGNWILGDLRTFGSVHFNHQKWVSETHSKRSLLKNYKSCEHSPISMMKDQERKSILDYFPPDPLHVVLLGPINDVMEKLEQIYPCEMTDEFYEENHLNKSGEGPGGKFNGPSVKQIIKESSLQQLEELLPIYSTACEFTDYLRTLRFVHEISVS